VIGGCAAHAWGLPWRAVLAMLFRGIVFDLDAAGLLWFD